MYIIACISFSTLPSQMLRLATNAAGPSSHILKTFESLVCSCHLLLKTQYLILLHSVLQASHIAVNTHCVNIDCTHLSHLLFDVPVWLSLCL